MGEHWQDEVSDEEWEDYVNEKHEAKLDEAPDEGRFECYYCGTVFVDEDEAIYCEEECRIQEESCAECGEHEDDCMCYASSEDGGY